MDIIKLKDYLSQGLSMGKIGKLEGVGQTTVRYWMKKHGLKAVCKPISEWDREDFLKHNRYGVYKNRGKKAIYSVDWKEVQGFYDLGKTWKDICEKFGTHEAMISQAQKEGLFVSRRNNESLKITNKKRPPVKLSEERKRKISEGRKKYLAANPDKHGWSNSKYHRSIPCELLKSKLIEAQIEFIEEFKPLLDQGRFFSIDIYFPKWKIGWEVNGCQHYEADGSLKPYYQNRNDLIQKSGIRLLEIRYHKVFSESYVEKLIESIRFLEVVGVAGIEPALSGLSSQP